MGKPENAMQIFRLLDQSNCGECGERTCLAFAGAVFRGEKKLRECPRLSREVVERFSEEPVTNEEGPGRYLDQLKSEAARTDLAEAARRTGGDFSGGKLTLKVLGRNFSVDGEGNLSADIHINPWVAVPFLNHVLYGKGLPISGKWVSFRDLEGGRERYPLFQKRCEEPVKRVADTCTDLFDLMVHLFSGVRVAEQFNSDISVVLYPLPKVPVIVCYWLPDEGLDSNLQLFFDETADRNLDIGSIFSLGGGLAQMFTRIALSHGFDATASA